MTNAARRFLSVLHVLLLAVALSSQALAAAGMPASDEEIGTTPAADGRWLPADTSRAAASSSEIPRTFGLHQNYPNPFNPTTSITYDVASQSHVRLVVYNMLGKQVATLVDRAHSPGSYQVTFDASHLTSGVYILSMKAANNFHAVRRMVLSK